MNGRTAALRSAGVFLALVISTGDIAGQSATRFNPPKQYYLALGDSLAFGFQFDKFNANVPFVPASIFSTGYVDVLSGMLREIRPGITTVNYGCPVETTLTFIQGGCTYTAVGFPLHDLYIGSPLQDSHPADLGCEEIARQIWAASGYDRLRSGGRQF